MGLFKKIFRNPIAHAILPNLGFIGGAIDAKAQGGGFNDMIKGGLGAAIRAAGAMAGAPLGEALGVSSALGGALSGAGAGAAGAALSGGNIGEGALGGAAGGYLTNGGASQLLGGTQLGNVLGLGNPEGGSLIGNALGGAPSGQTLGSSLGLTGANDVLGNAGSATGYTPQGFNWSPSTSGASGATKDFVQGLAGNSSNLAAAGSSGISNIGSSGGGMSSYGNLSTILGGANAMSAQEKAKKALLNANQNAMNQIAPYLQTGNAANASLMDALGLSGNTGADNYGALTKEFNPTDLTNEPGYQFQLQQGNQALDRANAARGGYFSGAAMKAAQDYGQGLAGQTYKDAFNRDLQTKQNLYNQLSGQQGVGYNAAGNMASLFGDYGNIKANTGVNSADILAKTLASLTGSKYYNSNPFLASLGIA